MHDPADHAPIVLSFHPAHIRRQMRFDPGPLLIAQPKQVLAHDPDLRGESKPYGIRIAFAQQHN
jgi:hypothetical protein